MPEGSKIPPMCLGILLADAIWQDPGSGKKTILGTFSTILAKQFPTTHPQLALYVVLTAGHGPTNVTIRLVDMEDEHLLEMEAEVEFSDPRMVADMAMHFRNVIFNHAGEYRFQVHAAGEFLMENK